MTGAGSIVLVVTTYESPESLTSCLQGLTAQTRPPDELILADDGSGEPTRRVIASFADRLPLRHVWRPHDGFRPSEMRNRALAVATADYVVLLDGDSVPHARFIEDHGRLAHPGRMVIGGRCGISGFFGQPMEAPDPLELARLLAAGRIYNDTDRAPQAPWLRLAGSMKGLRLPMPLYRRSFGRHRVHGGNMAFWREDALAVNGFDEEFVGWGFEDGDFTRRVERLGREVWQLLFHAVCYHINHPLLPITLANRELRLDESRPVVCVKGLAAHLQRRARGASGAAESAAGPQPHPPGFMASSEVPSE